MLTSSLKMIWISIVLYHNFHQKYMENKFSKNLFTKNEFYDIVTVGPPFTTRNIIREEKYDDTY